MIFLNLASSNRSTGVLYFQFNVKLDYDWNNTVVNKEYQCRKSA